MTIFVTGGAGFIGSNFAHVEWPFTGDPILSLKDIEGQKFEECEKYD